MVTLLDEAVPSVGDRMVTDAVSVAPASAEAVTTVAVVASAIGSSAMSVST